MQKRGQVTVFIVIGILILAVVLGMVYLSKYVVKEELKVGEEKAVEAALMTDSVKMFVEGCLEKSIINGIYLVSSQGGYYQFIDVNLFNFVEDEESLGLPYYFYSKEKDIPSLEFIEKETGKAAEDFFKGCVNGFKIFEKEGYEIEEGKEIIDIEFREKNILGELRLPLKITKGEKETTLDYFFNTVDIAFPEKYEIIKNYLIEQEKNPVYFLVGDLAWLAYEKSFSWSFDQYQEDGSDVIIDLRFDEQVKEEPLVFSFALNYDWIESEIIEEEILFEPGLELKRIPEWVITEPGIANLQIGAEGEGITFYTDADDFEINPETGLITLNPAEFENDEYWYFIKVTDVYNVSVMGPLYIYININEGNLPVIEPIEKQTVHAGEEFYYKVKATNPLEEQLVFISYTYLFDIDKQTGEISFTPTEDDAGTHTVRVDAENEYGSTWERFELEVLE